MVQSKALRGSRGPAACEEGSVTSKPNTATPHSPSQQLQPDLAKEIRMGSSRRECPSHARLRGSDDYNSSSPTPPHTGQQRRVSQPANQVARLSPLSQVPAMSSKPEECRTPTRSEPNTGQVQAEEQSSGFSSAQTIDLAPSKGLCEASELEIYTPWMQLEYSASDSIADSSTMDCSCSLPLSMASSSQTSNSKHWPPVPPAHPNTGGQLSRPNSGSFSGAYSKASQGTSRSSLSRAGSAKCQQQRGDSSATSLGSSMAMSTSSPSCSLELSAGLDTSSGGLPPRSSVPPSASFRGQGSRHWHKHPARAQVRMEAPQPQWGEQQKRAAISHMVHCVQRDTNYAASVAESLLRTYGLAAASEAATALFPAACSHPSQAAVLLQFVLGRPELRPEQAWAMHVLLVRAPKCALEVLLTPRHQFQPFQALASVITDLKNAAVAQSMARVLHHAAAAGAPVASWIDLAQLVAACERLGCQDSVRDLLVALWQQNQNDTDAAHNCLARMVCPEIHKPHLEVPMDTLQRIAVAGTHIKDCFMLVPTAEPPYFGRQRCTFPAAPLADVAPAAAEVATSTLGTGTHGVVVRSHLGGQSHALKVSYRTAEASLGLQTEVEAHARIWAALSKRDHVPSPHLCLASFVVYSEVDAGGSKVLLVDGLAMPCVDGTLWDYWNGCSGVSTGAAAARSSSAAAGGLQWGPASTQGPAGRLAGSCWMALTLAKGLHSLHAANCVHNDLHPQNVGVKRLPSVAAVAASHESHVLDLGRVVTSGTECDRFRDDGSFWPVWHPPEAIDGEGKEGLQVTLECSADVWAFGCILVSLLKDAPAFALAEGYCHAKWPLLANGEMWLEALRSVPEDSVGLKAVAAQCLCAAPEQRPAMAQVRASLTVCASRCGLPADLPR